MYRLLIVDDEQEMRENIAEILAADDMEISTVENGELRCNELKNRPMIWFCLIFSCPESAAWTSCP